MEQFFLQTKGTKRDPDIQKKKYMARQAKDMSHKKVRK